MEKKMSIQGTIFAPTHLDEFYSIVGERYASARAEAARIGDSKQIQMRLEHLKPVHFEWTTYELPTGDTLITLEDNCALFPYAILNNDESFDYMKWYQGNKIIYIGDWFVKPIYFFQEKQGAYKGNLSHYEFRAGETFTFTVHSTTTPTPSEVDAWLMAFVVLPRTLAETKITK
ncbi:hypothetical protein ES703_63832 [subsurface metagenome]